MLEETVDEVVEASWQIISPVSGGLAQRVKAAHEALHAWDMHVLKEPQRHLRALQDEVDGWSAI